MKPTPDTREDMEVARRELQASEAATLTAKQARVSETRLICNCTVVDTASALAGATQSRGQAHGAATETSQR